MQEQNPSETDTTQESVLDLNSKLWDEQTILKTSWHLARRVGLDAWNRYEAEHIGEDDRFLNTLRLFAIYFDRFSIPHEFWTAEAIAACMRICIEKAGRADDLIVPSATLVREWLIRLGLKVNSPPIVTGFGEEGITGFNIEAARRHGLPPLQEEQV